MLRYRYNEDVNPFLDDADTSVMYSGDWRTNASFAAYIQVYGSTIHYTWQRNTSASISFYGSYITVFGTIPSNFELKNAGITTAGSQAQSSYQFDDGPTEFFNVTLDASQNFMDQAFFQPSTTQPDGHHTLVITNLVGILTLDYFTIVPTNTGSSPYVQKIDDASPNMTYNNTEPFSSTSGSDHNSTLHNLSSPQSTASLNFNGNFVAVYGALPPGNSLPVVLFTLDDGDKFVTTGKGDSSGSMPRLPASRKQRLSQVLFWKSSTLANGQHNLLITATQGEFLLDFILIQTSDSAGSGTTFSPQSLKSTTQLIAVPSSTTVPPYGNTTSSGSVSRSSPTSSTGASSGHTKNTSVIVGGAVGGAVGFVMLLLAALYMIRILSKRRSGLRSKTQSNLKSSYQPPVKARFPVTTAAITGKSNVVDSSGQHVTGYILRSSLGFVPPLRRSNTVSFSPLPQDLTRLSLPTNSQRMSGSIATFYIDNSCLPVRQSMLDAHQSSLPSALPPANRSSTGHGPYQGYEHTLVTQRPPLPSSLLPVNRSNTGQDPHQGYERTLYSERSPLLPSLPRANQSNTCPHHHDGDECMLETQRPSLPPSLSPTYQSNTGHSSHQGCEHTSDTQRPSLPTLLPPAYLSSTGHQGYEHTIDTQRPSLPPSLPPTYRSIISYNPHQGYGHILCTHRPSLPPSLPPTYRSSVGRGSHQGYDPYEGMVKN